MFVNYPILPYCNDQGVIMLINNHNSVYAVFDQLIAAAQKVATLR